MIFSIGLELEESRAGAKEECNGLWTCRRFLYAIRLGTQFLVHPMFKLELKSNHVHFIRPFLWHGIVGMNRIREDEKAYVGLVYLALAPTPRKTLKLSRDQKNTSTNLPTSNIEVSKCTLVTCFVLIGLQIFTQASSRLSPSPFRVAILPSYLYVVVVAAVPPPPPPPASVPPSPARDGRWKVEEETIGEGAGRTLVKTSAFTTPGQYKASLCVCVLYLVSFRDKRIPTCCWTRHCAIFIPRQGLAFAGSSICHEKSLDYELQVFFVFMSAGGPKTPRNSRREEKVQEEAA